MDYEELLKEADRLMKSPGGASKAGELYLRALESNPANLDFVFKLAHSIQWGDDWGQVSLASDN